MKLHERRFSEVEKRIKDMLINSDKDIGVAIDHQRFFQRPLEKEGFTAEEIIYTIRGLAGKGYFAPYDRNSGDSLATLKLTQLGRDEWLLGASHDAGKKVFLSYSTIDKKLAGEIKKGLDAVGFDVFLAHETIELSEEFHEKIIKELQVCDYFLALRTKSFTTSSSYPDQECGMAVAFGKKIIPLIIDTKPSTYGFLHLRQGFRFDPTKVKKSCKKLSEKLTKE